MTHMQCISPYTFDAVVACVVSGGMLSLDKSLCQLYSTHVWRVLYL